MCASAERPRGVNGLLFCNDILVFIHFWRGCVCVIQVRCSTLRAHSMSSLYTEEYSFETEKTCGPCRLCDAVWYTAYMRVYADLNRT